MTWKPTVNGGEKGGRSGAQTLILLAAPLNSTILRALSRGPKQQLELRRETGSPATTTLRAQLKRLGEIGAIEKRRRNRFPGILEYDLTPSGRDLLTVVDALDAWLIDAPDGPLELGGNAAKASVKALADAWSTTMLRALAAGPLSLTQLDGVISSLSYPALERRLSALRLTGLIERRPNRGRATPYAVTDWLRRGIGPLAAAARWERRYRPDATSPITRIDVEAAFLLTVPLLRTPDRLSGVCRLAVEVPSGDVRRLAGVLATVEHSTVTSCGTRLEGPADAWALGTAPAWFDAIVEGNYKRLELGGNGQLAKALLGSLHSTLATPPLARGPLPQT